MVELPSVAVKIRAAFVISDGFPAFMIERPVTDHFVILRLMAAGRLGIVESVSQAHAVERTLIDATDGLWLRQAKDFEHGRRDVNQVMILRAQSTFFGNPFGPVNDERIGVAAGMRVLLVAFQRCVARHGPALWIMGVGQRTAHFIDQLQIQLHVFRNLVEVQRLIERAGQTAFLACSVVRNDDQQSIFQELVIFEKRNQPSDVLIAMRQKSGENFLQPRKQPAVIRR